MEKYSIEWKEAQNKHGGWAQKHGEVWEWHYIRNGAEYATRKQYPTKRVAIAENKGVSHA
jgi:hypothetical protein